MGNFCTTPWNQPSRDLVHIQWTTDLHFHLYAKGMYTPVPSNNEKEIPTKEALRTFSDVVSVSKATIFAASNSVKTH